MAVTIIPNVTNWTVTPQNGQSGYFTLMNTWLGQSTTVIQSLYDAIEAQNTANSEINALANEVQDNADITVAAKDEAVGALAILSAGAIDDINIATNKAYSNQKSNELLNLKVDKDFSSLTSVTPAATDTLILNDASDSNNLKSTTMTNLASFMAGDSSTGIGSSSGVLSFYPYGLTTATTELTTSDFVVVSDSTVPKKITIANLANEFPLLGVGQTWQDVTVSRAINVTYTNSTGKMIIVKIEIGAGVRGYIDDIVVFTTPAIANSTIYLFVPNGSTYKTNGTPVNWLELR